MGFMALRLAAAVSLFFGLQAAPTFAGVVHTFYASPIGTGTVCSFSAPCSLRGAQAAVRAVTSGMTGDVRVLLHGGKYYLSTALTFTESDSGLNGHQVAWQNYPGEIPEIVGGTPVTGWTLSSANIYKALVGVGLTVNALYENGARAHKARYPKTGYLMDANGSGGIAKQDAGYMQAWFTFEGGDLPNWPDMVGGEVVVWGYWDWFESTLPIASFDYANKKVGLTRPPFWGLINTTNDLPKTQTQHDRYFVQNVYSALSDSAEFYYNSATGYLYYYPRSKPISSQEVVLPRMKNAVELKGSSTTATVHDIQLKGIRVWGTDFTHTFDSWADPTHMLSYGKGGTAQHFENNEPAENRWGNIYLTNANRITLDSLRISASGYSGIELDRYCQNIAVVNSVVRDVGYHGIAINGGLDNSTDVLISKNIVINNNEIYRIGQLVGHGAGVHIEQSAYDHITHNDIHDGRRHGLDIEGAAHSPAAANLAAHNLIDYNRFYELNVDSADTGNVYQFVGGPNNIYDHNISFGSHGLQEDPGGTANGAYYLDFDVVGATLSNDIGYAPEVLVNTSRFGSSKDPTACRNGSNCQLNVVLKSNNSDWIAAGLISAQMGRMQTRHGPR